MNRCLGQWNAYVAAGKTKAIRKNRFDEVPQELKPQVRSHLKTIAETMKVNK